ncbi:MAG: HAMP domain-containing sensor histidine kinase [Coriobacteriia bacterium]
MSSAETPLPLAADENDAEPPHPPKSPHTFSRRLALAFAVVAALTAALAGLLLSAVWNYQFTQYVQANLQVTADGVAQISAQAYPQLGGWTIQTMSQIPRFGPATGIGVQILDPSGKIVYDDASMSAHIREIVGLGGAQNKDPESEVVLEPRGSVVTSKVMVGGRQVGTVRVWAYSAGALMTDRDQKFKRGSLAGLTIAALVAIAFASLGGVWYASRLVRPIERITETAQAMKAGDREARTRLEGNDEIGFLGQTFDEMADAIEADREMERRLTADVAHELRTPLQAIQATVEAMQDGVLPADEERLGIVRDETMRLARLADGILELTRLERGSVPFTCVRIDLAGPVRAAVDTHEALIETRQIVLSVDIAERTYACVDSDRLQQAVGNLLSNAARYTPAGGRIEVSVRRDAGQAVIEVADTGMGIAEKDLPLVFSRFWRADEARATTSGGLGIGLAVTKEIVERHKGTIGVSRRSGGGSVFAIRLPLA